MIGKMKIQKVLEIKCEMLAECEASKLAKLDSLKFMTTVIM